MKFLSVDQKDLNDKEIFPNCTILDSWVLANFMLADELFAKVLWSLKTCVSVNYNIC